MSPKAATPPACRARAARISSSERDSDNRSSVARRGALDEVDDQRPETIVTPEALGGEMADFGGSHSRRQILRTERSREVVDAQLEDSDAIDFAVGVTDGNDLGAGERAPDLRNQECVEAAEVENHDVGRIGRRRRRGGFRRREDLAAVRLEN